MKWNIPARWQENVNLSVILICFVGFFTGFAALSALGYFIYCLSFYEDLQENEFVVSR